MSKHSWLATAALVAGLGLPAVASAEPAKIAPAQDSAFRAFGKFARSWMGEMEQRERQNKRTPTIERQGSRRIASYTGYAPEWNVEVHATGDRTSPYVGVLHYQEQLYVCQDETTKRCRLSRSTPVTEVFPYRDGAWKY